MHRIQIGEGKRSHLEEISDVGRTGFTLCGLEIRYYGSILTQSRLPLCRNCQRRYEKEAREGLTL